MTDKTAITTTSVELANTDSVAPVPSDVLANPLTDAAAVMFMSLSPGELLRDARVNSGMHIAALAMLLKVPVKKLEALESDDWANLPDAVFARALAASVCRHIKVDSAPILALLPKKAGTQMMGDSDTKSLDHQFSVTSDSKLNLLKRPPSIPLMLGAVILLLAAIVIIFLPDMVQRTDAKKIEVMETVAPIAIHAPTDLASAVILPEVSVVPEVPSSSPVVIASAPPPVPSANAVIETPALLRMQAKGLVWVEVKDAKRVLLLRRTLQPKEVATVSGATPLAVVVGRINQMESIDVRGMPFNSTGLSPDNVARFEIK